MRVAAHAHRDELDERRALPARARSAAQVNAAAIASGSVPSIVMPGMP